MIIYVCDACGKTVENEEQFSPRCYVGDGVYDLCSDCLDELNESVKNRAQEKIEEMLRNKNSAPIEEPVF